MKTNRVFERIMDEQSDVDLMDMTKIAADNDGYRYLFLAINIFFHYVWMVPLKDKSGNEVVHVFCKIFKQGVPEIVHLDKSTEFLGDKVQSFSNCT